MMTSTPTDTPSKAKAWWALLGGVLATLATILPQIAGVLPPPWGPLLTGIVGVLGILVTPAAVHQAPWLPPNTTIVPKMDVTLPPTSGWPNP